MELRLRFLKYCGIRVHVFKSMVGLGLRFLKHVGIKIEVFEACLD